MRYVVNFLKGGYYQLYIFLTAIGHPGLYAESLASFSVAMLPWFNFMTLLKILERRSMVSNLGTEVMVVFYLVYIAGMLIYFFTGDRHKSITANYKANPLTTSRKILFYIYGFGSVILYYTI